MRRTLSNGENQNDFQETGTNICDGDANKQIPKIKQTTLIFHTHNSLILFLPTLTPQAVSTYNDFYSQLYTNDFVLGLFAVSSQSHLY